MEAIRIGTPNLPRRVKWIDALIYILVVIDFLAFAANSCNNGAIELADQDSDRYDSITFYRIFFVPAFYILSPLVSAFIVERKDSATYMGFDVIVVLAVIVLQFLELMFVVYDYATCANTTPCTGLGNHHVILGMDFAYIFYVVFTLVQFACNILILFLNFDLRRALTHYQDLLRLLGTNFSTSTSSYMGAPIDENQIEFPCEQRSLSKEDRAYLKELQKKHADERKFFKERPMLKMLVELIVPPPASEL